MDSLLQITYVLPFVIILSVRKPRAWNWNRIAPRAMLDPSLSTHCIFITFPNVAVSIKQGFKGFIVGCFALVVFFIIICLFRIWRMGDSRISSILNEPKKMTQYLS